MIASWRKSPLQYFVCVSKCKISSFRCGATHHFKSTYFISVRHIFSHIELAVEERDLAMVLKHLVDIFVSFMSIKPPHIVLDTLNSLLGKRIPEYGETLICLQKLQYKAVCRREGTKRTNHSTASPAVMV